MKPFEKWWESSGFNNQNEVPISFSDSFYSYYSLEPRKYYDRAFRRRLLERRELIFIMGLGALGTLQS